jgi:NADH-quinone oxidoreductase subunit G
MGKQVNIKIDGKDLTVPAEWTVIKAAQENGIEIPHYCYHENLSVAGNCRICMVGLKGAPRPVVACAQPVAEGMEVTTSGKDVEEARKGVMEFLLINHPLDCPECDQAGECKLQDYSYDYGRDHGRFHEDKVVKSKATFGSHVKYWGSRCIVCTRCVRFTSEVSGEGELNVIYRGDRSEIALFPGQTLDNPLSMNVVDICPVGALVSSDFLYQSRVWNLHGKDSLCVECSVGCNTRVDLDAKEQIKRIVPRKNDAVNKTWMCDHGRLSFNYLYEKRLHKPKIDGQDAMYREAVSKSADLLRGSGAGAGSKTGSNALLVSAWASNEAIAAAKRVAETYGLPLHGYAKAKTDDQVFPGFTIAGDKNPNRAGLVAALGVEPEASLAALADKAKQGKLGTVVVVHGIPGGEAAPELAAVLAKAEHVILLDFGDGALLRSGNVTVALPTLTAYEQSGTYVNKDGISQKAEPVMEPVTYGRPAAEVLRDLAKAGSTLSGIQAGAKVGASPTVGAKSA